MYFIGLASLEIIISWQTDEVMGVLQLFISLLILSCIHKAFSQGDTIQAECRGYILCGECIIGDPSCAWCEDVDYEEAKCDLPDHLTTNGCRNITFPEGQVNTVQDDPLSDAADTADNRAVQVSPQLINVTLKVGEPKTVKMNLRLAEDYPLDIYYLTDLSKSFSGDLTNVRNLAGTLIDRLKLQTSDLRIGLGGFVDKTALPYVSARDIRQCIGSSSEDDECCEDCIDPFSFKNYLSLTNDTDQFISAVNDLATSTSLDTPEGGFDALVQVISCQDMIGWREHARRMIFLATDATAHLAGDGKLAGISKANDGQCYTDGATGEYKKSVEMDYPSIGQVNSLLQKNNIILVIAGAVNYDNAKFVSIYKDMLPYIQGADVGILGADSGRLINLILISYQRVTEELEVVDNAPDNIQVSYTSNCFDDEPRKGSSRCDYVRLGEEFNFDVELTATSCPANGERQTFSVSPIGLNERLAIEVNVVCNCDCEKSQIRDNLTCSDNGNMVCGQCECDVGQYGVNCECDGNEEELADESGCFAMNSTIKCNGRGYCVCGSCVCNKQMDSTQVISGKYCECDNFSCDRDRGGELCGGENQGTCVCGECRCKPSYKGSACECLKRTDACETPSGLLCNGFGDCVCGSCVCNTVSPFQGPTCSDCPTCNGMCSLFQECALCAVESTGYYSDEMCNMCQLSVTVVDNINETATNGMICQYNVGDNCTITYAYQDVNGTYFISIEDEPLCIEPLGPSFFESNWRWLLVGLIVLIIVIGLIIIALIKLSIHIHERIEYKKFMAEVKASRRSGNVNPLYKSATTTITNPKYGTGL